MPTIETFLLIIAFFYLAESFMRIRPSVVLFRRLSGTAFSINLSGQRARTGKQSGDYAMVPLLPSSKAILTELVALDVDREEIRYPGVLELPSDTPPEEISWALAWKELHTIERDEKTLLLNRAFRVTFCTIALAAHWQQLLERWKTLPSKQREAAIQTEWTRSLDVTAIQQEWSRVEATLRPLSLAANGMALYLFVVIPLINRLELAVSGLAQGFAYLFFLLTVQVLTFLAHRRLEPEARMKRFGLVLQMIASPADAMHAPGELGKDRLCTYHPLAVAQVLCSPAVLARIARQMLRGLEYGRQARAEASVAHVGALLVASLKKAGLEPEHLLAPPEPEDESSRSYCPRCERQFQLQSGDCPVCGTVSLRALV